MRQVKVNKLWLQGKVAEGIIKVSKIPGSGHQSDILTNQVNAQTLVNHIAKLNHVIRSDRYDIMPDMVGDQREA